MTQTNSCCFPEREAPAQVLTGKSLRHVAHALRLSESLLSKCEVPARTARRQYLPSHGQQHGESAARNRLRQQLA